MNRFSFRALFSIIALLIVCLGCRDNSPALAPVSGKVLIDGNPLTTGRVTTIPAAGRGASGTIQPDGTFELSTYGDRDGAIIGRHSVAVVAYEGAMAGPEGNRGKLLVPGRYTNDQTSGLTIDVNADGDNHPVLELYSK